MRTRILVWNVHGFRSGVGTVADVAVRLAPDIVLLNETGWSGWRLRRFARRLGARAADGHRLWRRGIPNAVLVRPPWRLVGDDRILLPRARGSRRRGLVSAVVGHAGYRLTAAAVHLGLSGPERGSHARTLADLVRSFRPPALLGGDLNESPDGPAAAWLADRLWDAFAVAGEGEGATFPSADPGARIDYLFVTEGVRVIAARVVEEAAEASDHLPVLVDLELP